MNPLNTGAARQETCFDCGGSGEHPWTARNKAWADTPCPTCKGRGTRSAASWDPPPLSPEQHAVDSTSDWQERGRRQLDLAKARAPGTTVWRGEVRHSDDLGHPQSVGMHWTANPDQIVTQHHAPEPGHHRVIWEGVIDHPDQAFDRSHPMWSGKHRSMDSESEVRFRPGQQVRVTRRYVHDGSTDDRLFAPHKPGRSSGAWQMHEMNHPVEVQHGRGGVSDYSQFGIQHGAARPGPSLEHHGAMESDAPEDDSHLLKFNHEAWQSGGSLYPNEERITAHHPDRGTVGHVHFLRGQRENSPVLIKMVRVEPGHRRRGYGSALADQLQSHYPKAKIKWGDFTDDGKAWWKSYGQGADRRGRTGSRPFDRAARLGDGRLCQGCAGIGELHDGHECGACDGSGRDPDCICGRSVTKQPGEDWWSHLDGSISHDYEDKVPQDEHGPLGVADCMRMLGKAELPTRRLFGPTYGLDHRLFDGDCLRDDVTEYVLGTLGRFWEPLYGLNWRKWARVYLAGSEASEWTSETLEGNNDFDVLIGIEYDDMRDDMKSRPGLDTLFGMMTDEQVTNALNQQLRAGLTPHTSGEHPATIMIDGTPTGPWDNTFYVNQDSWSIKNIKPYAAYDVTNHRWAVRPPHLPDWSISQFPEGHALVAECKAVEAYVRAVLRLPEPYRAQQADALWKHLHGDRSRAFGPQGEGWYDPGNVIEKFLDQKGVWEPLAQAHFDAVADPSRLLAPSDWSNDPVPVPVPPR